MDFQFLEIDKLHARYIDTGGKDAVLLVHGLGGSIESWKSNIDELAKDLRVIALDLPGFGYSDKPEMNYTIKFYWNFVSKFIEELNLAPVAVVGSSLGGHVAAEVAINRPDLVSKLVLISTPGALPRSFKGTPALKRYMKVIHARSMEQVRKALVAVDNKPVDDAYAEAVYQRLAMPGAKEAFMSALRGSAQARRLDKLLNKIKAPTLVFWGKEDIMIPVKFVEPFVKMKGSRVVLLENCGHRAHADKPAVVNRMLVDFVKEG